MRKGAAVARGPPSKLLVVSSASYPKAVTILSTEILRLASLAQKLTRSPSRACHRDRTSEVLNGLSGSTMALVKFCR